MTPTLPSTLTSVTATRPAPVIATAAAATAVGLAVGSATSFLQTVLPPPFEGLANAVSPWLMAPTAVGLLLARRRGDAVLLGVLTCAAQVVGYYVTADLRGFGVGSAYVIVWTVAAVVGGPVFALLGRLTRVADGRWRGVGPAAVAALWAAEALVQYLVVLGYRDDAAVFGCVSVVLLVVLGRSARQLRPAVLWFPVALAAGALAFAGLTVLLQAGPPSV